MYRAEQVFKAICVSMHADNEEFPDIIRAVLYAPTPADAKKAPARLTNFKAPAWDKLAPAAMWVAQALRCTDEQVFCMFQTMLKTVRADGAVKRFLAVESNGLDNLWGIGLYTQPLIDKLAKLTLSDSLIADAQAAFLGKNQLGTIITEFLLAIEGMTYKEYMAELDDIMWATLIEKRPDEATEHVFEFDRELSPDIEEPPTSIPRLHSEPAAA
jgi:predicted NAD-dependent protein-ADP-ribosyltransferase YbiA (DUF1768 family)